MLPEITKLNVRGNEMPVGFPTIVKPERYDDPLLAGKDRPGALASVAVACKLPRALALAEVDAPGPVAVVVTVP
jgi:hypothetical protein